MQVTLAGANENPFTPKAYPMRYWDKTVTNNSPKSPFLLSKASPLTALESATYSKLGKQKYLSSVLPSFCSSAKLFRFPDLSLSREKHDADSNVTVYENKNFTNYDSSWTRWTENVEVDSFRLYSRDSAGHTLLGATLWTTASTHTDPWIFENDLTWTISDRTG